MTKKQFLQALQSLGLTPSGKTTADALGLSLRSAQRGWMRARAWLRADLEGSETDLG